MDADEPGWAMVDDVFRDLAVGRSTATTRRYLRVRARFYAFLDTADLGPAQGSDVAETLADDIARCLPAFAGEPWLPDGLAEARVHLSVVSRLAARLGPAAARRRTDAAVVQSRERLARRAPGDVVPARLPDRFRSRPGPEW
jgi:hypothetical protein